GFLNKQLETSKSRNLAPSKFL
ncbi:hypothetical protein CISIN_1g0339362mg, partial [Citrus sinensis]